MIKPAFTNDLRRFFKPAGLLMALTLTAGSIPLAHAEDPAPEATEESTPAKEAGVSVAGLLFEKPEGWFAVEPSSSMRAAQWEVGEGDKKGEAVFFYFGRDQGGSIEANFARWINQFKESSEDLNAQRAELEGDIAKVSFIRATGTYNASMPGQVKEDMPDTMLIGAVVTGPEGNVFVKFTGPSAVVSKNEADFLNSLAKAAGADNS